MDNVHNTTPPVNPTVRSPGLSEFSAPRTVSPKRSDPPPVQAVHHVNILNSKANTTYTGPITSTSISTFSPPYVHSVRPPIGPSTTTIQSNVISSPKAISNSATTPAPGGESTLKMNIPYHFVTIWVPIRISIRWMFSLQIAT
eukprot:TRINITY_DN9212_c0_g2_i1.p1 TRINITY_DN9212_c0_g2~~TRINITY_DN9212_c0_g2_i1.p1  ORF type:complete len:152 (-),score=0.10 TRINITY_DN9212_c0_g2_i1:101-529(-)